jgi:hypothetical protein
MKLRLTGTYLERGVLQLSPSAIIPLRSSSLNVLEPRRLGPDLGWAQATLTPSPRNQIV